MSKFEQWFSDNRNVVDKYKGLSTEDIRSDLDSNQLNISILMQQIEHDFNFGSIIRSANAMGIRNVYYYSDRKKFDRRGAVGTYLYTIVNYLDSLDAVKELSGNYSFVGLENNINYSCSDIMEFNWPSNPMLVIGEENNGLVPELLDMCQHIVYISQRGSVRSLNAAVAASIALYDFSFKSLQKSV